MIKTPLSRQFFRNNSATGFKIEKKDNNQPIHQLIMPKKIIKPVSASKLKTQPVVKSKSNFN